MNEPGNENVRIGGVADELEQLDMPDERQKVRIDLEARLMFLQHNCAVNTGLEMFPFFDQRRASVLRDIRTFRPLTDFEVIQLNNRPNEDAP